MTGAASLPLLSSNQIVQAQLCCIFIAYATFMLHLFLAIEPPSDRRQRPSVILADLPFRCAQSAAE